MSTLDIFVSENADELLDNDDQVFANRQTTRHVCGALKRYFEAHLVLEVDRQLSSSGKVDRPESEKKPYKVSLSFFFLILCFLIILAIVKFK